MGGASGIGAGQISGVHVIIMHIAWRGIVGRGFPPSHSSMRVYANAHMNPTSDQGFRGATDTEDIQFGQRRKENDVV